MHTVTGITQVFVLVCGSEHGGGEAGMCLTVPHG